jgi:hypothetical protein
MSWHETILLNFFCYTHYLLTSGKTRLSHIIPLIAFLMMTTCVVWGPLLLEIWANDVNSWRIVSQVCCNTSRRKSFMNIVLYCLFSFFFLQMAIRQWSKMGCARVTSWTRCSVRRALRRTSAIPMLTVQANRSVAQLGARKSASILFTPVSIVHFSQYIEKKIIWSFKQKNAQDRWSTWRLSESTKEKNKLVSIRCGQKYSQMKIIVFPGSRESGLEHIRDWFK